MNNQLRQLSLDKTEKEEDSSSSSGSSSLVDTPSIASASSRAPPTDANCTLFVNSRDREQSHLFSTLNTNQHQLPQQQQAGNVPAFLNNHNNNNNTTNLGSQQDFRAYLYQQHQQSLLLNNNIQGQTQFGDLSAREQSSQLGGSVVVNPNIANPALINAQQALYQQWYWQYYQQWNQYMMMNNSAYQQHLLQQYYQFMIQQQQLLEQQSPQQYPTANSQSDNPVSLSPRLLAQVQQAQQQSIQQQPPQSNSPVFNPLTFGSSSAELSSKSALLPKLPVNSNTTTTKDNQTQNIAALNRSIPLLPLPSPKSTVVSVLDNQNDFAMAPKNRKTPPKGQNTSTGKPQPPPSAQTASAQPNPRQNRSQQPKQQQQHQQAHTSKQAAPIRILRRPEETASTSSVKKGQAPPAPVQPPLGPKGQVMNVGPNQPKGRINTDAKRREILRDRTQNMLRAYLQNVYQNYSLTNLYDRLTRREDIACLRDIIGQFMRHLERRFSMIDISYLDLADKRHEDFAFYSERFIDLIYSLKGCPQYAGFGDGLIRKYEELIEKYIRMHPESVLKFRLKLITIRNALTKDNCINQNNIGTMVSLKPEMVTFKQVTSMRLHKIITSIDNVPQRLQFFIKEIALSRAGFNNLNSFITLLRNALRTSPLCELDVQVYPFGSLSNGLGTFDSDLDIVLQFNRIINPNRDKLDYETSMMILRIIRLILPKRLGFKVGEELREAVQIVPSKRCPIIKLDFEQCCRDMVKGIKEHNENPLNRPISFNKCDLSVTSVYGVYNSKLLKFLTQYDPRFREMTLLLKYWAKKNGLINTEGFSSYALTMMIVFYLQTCEPAVLPAISDLQKLAVEVGMPKVNIHGFNFEFCDDLSLAPRGPINPNTTEQLIVDFFKYYRHFNYLFDAISPRLGRIIKKEALYREKVKQNLGFSFKQSLICVEDPFVLEHNPGSIFHEHYMPKWTKILENVLDKWKIDQNNCVPLLTNPELWDPTPPPQPSKNSEAKDWKNRVKLLQEELSPTEKKNGEANTEEHNSETEESDAIVVPLPEGPLVEFEMVTYKKIEPRMLFETISSISSATAQLSTILDAIRLSPEYYVAQTNFVALLNQGIQSCHSFVDLKPKIIQVGSQLAGISSYNSDLNLIVTFDSGKHWSFENFDQVRSVLKMVQLVLQHRLGFNKRNMRKEQFTPSIRRRPILQMHLYSCVKKFKPSQVEPVVEQANEQQDQTVNSSSEVNKQETNVKYNRLDFTVGQPFGVHQAELLKLFSAYDSRFEQLTLILKYWAKQNGLINADVARQTDSMSSYAFTLMVVYFMQCTTPAILPSVKELQLLTKFEVPPRKVTKIGKYQLEFCTDLELIRSKSNRKVNHDSTIELIEKFFRFYMNLKYFAHAILPKHGANGLNITLKDLYTEKSSMRIGRSFKASEIVIEDPLMPEWNLGITCKTKWLYCLRRFLAEVSTRNENAILLLTNPDNFHGYQQESTPTAVSSSASDTSKQPIVVKEEEIIKTEEDHVTAQVETLTDDIEDETNEENLEEDEESERTTQLNDSSLTEEDDD